MLERDERDGEKRIERYAWGTKRSKTVCVCVCASEKAMTKRSSSLLRLPRVTVEMDKSVWQ